MIDREIDLQAVSDNHQRFHEVQYQRILDVRYPPPVSLFRLVSLSQLDFGFRGVGQCVCFSETQDVQPMENTV